MCFPDLSKEIIDTNETLGIGACLVNAHHIPCFCLTMLQEMWISPLEASHSADGPKDSVPDAGSQIIPVIGGGKGHEIRRWCGIAA